MTFQRLLIHKSISQHFTTLFVNIYPHEFQLIDKIVKRKIHVEILHHIEILHALTKFIKTKNRIVIIVLVFLIELELLLISRRYFRCQREKL